MAQSVSKQALVYYPYVPRTSCGSAAKRRGLHGRDTWGGSLHYTTLHQVQVQEEVGMEVEKEVEEEEVE